MDYVLIPEVEILAERMREAGVFTQNQPKEQGKTTVWDFLSAISGRELTGKQLSAYWKTCRDEWMDTLIRFYQQGHPSITVYERSAFGQILTAIDVGRAVHGQALDCLTEIFVNAAKAD